MLLIYHIGDFTLEFPRRVEGSARPLPSTQDNQKQQSVVRSSTCPAALGLEDNAKGNSTKSQPARKPAERHQTRPAKETRTEHVLREYAIAIIQRYYLVLCRHGEARRNGAHCTVGLHALSEEFHCLLLVTVKLAQPAVPSTLRGSRAPLALLSHTPTKATTNSAVSFKGCGMLGVAHARLVSSPTTYGRGHSLLCDHPLLISTRAY